MKTLIVAAALVAAVSGSDLGPSGETEVQTAEQVRSLIPEGISKEQALQTLVDSGIEHSYLPRKDVVIITPPLGELEDARGPIDGLIMAILRDLETVGIVTRSLQILILIRDDEVSELRFQEILTGP
jgi:hypothetical protein